MKHTMVHLGYEVGTGEPVSIPLRHLAVTGQTQEAGKTTTLEALIARSELRALTFVTKRGEGSFTNARRIQPYFREQADWSYVAAILEASRGERMKMERAFIIRASKGARTLADVHANVKKLLADPRVRGLAADMYLCLDAYLEVVVPQIQAVKWATALELERGVNVMDLGDLPIEMQHLVIRSALGWILEREQHTVVVVPEAWKFLPQGRGTPVKLAAEALIRQGAGLGNYLWLDSQDLGGIDKAILRSVIVWLLGVQREANEIKRTLDNIPAIPAKPTPAEIATLKLGQFFACWSDKRVKTYVQPTWMKEGEAHSVAMGSIPVHDQKPKEEPEMCEKHQQLERELDKVQADLRNLGLDADRHAKRAQAAETKAEQYRLQASAAQDLGRAIARILPAGVEGLAAGSGASLDEEEIVRRVLARVPTGGGAPLQVTAPEALRLQVQRDITERLLAEARTLPPVAKRLLKVLVALDKRISQRAAAERAGVGWGGNVIEAYKALSRSSLTDSDPKNGTRAAVRDRIIADLGDLGAKEDTVEATYQAVLYALATGEEAAA